MDDEKSFFASILTFEVTFEVSCHSMLPLQTIHIDALQFSVRKWLILFVLLL